MAKPPAEGEGGRLSEAQVLGSLAGRRVVDRPSLAVVKPRPDAIAARLDRDNARAATEKSDPQRIIPPTH